MWPDRVKLVALDMVGSGLWVSGQERGEPELRSAAAEQPNTFDGTKRQDCTTGQHEQGDSHDGPADAGPQDRQGRHGAHRCAPDWQRACTVAVRLPHVCCKAAKVVPKRPCGAERHVGDGCRRALCSLHHGPSRPRFQLEGPAAAPWPGLRRCDRPAAGRPAARGQHPLPRPGARRTATGAGWSGGWTWWWCGSRI